MSGVAVGNDRAGRKLRGDTGKLILGTQPIGRRIVKGSAVEIDRTWNVAVGLGGRGLLLAVEVARRASIDERGVLVVLHGGELREKPLVETRRENFRRRNNLAVVDRIGRGLPGVKSTIENRHRRMAR